MHCLAMDILLLRIRCCDVVTGLLPSNERPSIVGCALVGTCLPIRLLETAQSVTIVTFQIELKDSNLLKKMMCTI
jgi:hypothetical protein